MARLRRVRPGQPGPGRLAGCPAAAPGAARGGDPDRTQGDAPSGYELHDVSKARSTEELRRASWHDQLGLSGEPPQGRQIEVRYLPPGAMLPGLPDFVSGFMALLETYDTVIQMDSLAQEFGVREHHARIDDDNIVAVA